MTKSKLVVTERDSDLLVDLYKHRFLTVPQIRRLHFPSLQTTYRRIRLLHAAGFVHRFDVANIPDVVITLAPGGLTAVGEALGIERRDLKWSLTTARPRDYYFMRHLLAINEFRIHLKLACAASDLQLLGFIPDYYGERTNGSGITKYIRDVISDITVQRQPLAHTPDGVFALARNGIAALFFLEIDRGTEEVSNPDKGLLKSIRFYNQYLLTGGYQRYGQDFGAREFKGFRSLYVTTSDIRIENLRKATMSLDVPPKAKRFHWLTTFGKVSAETLFTPIWVSADVTDTTTYHIS